MPLSIIFRRIPIFEFPFLPIIAKPGEWNGKNSVQKIIVNLFDKLRKSRLYLLLWTNILQNQLAVVGWNLTYASAFGLNNRKTATCSHKYLLCASDNDVRCVSLINGYFSCNGSSWGKRLKHYFNNFYFSLFPPVSLSYNKH